MVIKVPKEEQLPKAEFGGVAESEVLDCNIWQVHKTLPHKASAAHSNISKALWFLQRMEELLVS